MNTGLLIYLISIIVEWVILLRIKHNYTHYITIGDVFITFIISLLGPIAIILTLIVFAMIKLEDEGILNKRL